MVNLGQLFIGVSLGTRFTRDFIRTAPDRFFLMLSTYNPHKPAPVAGRHKETHFATVAPRTPYYNVIGTNEPSWLRDQPVIAPWRQARLDRARYNYEDRETGSVWVGYNLSFGEKVTLDLTPMLGGVFGETDGVAPGYKAALGWGRFELSSESEYVIDTGDSSESFFYTWSELAWGPADWCRLGLVVQRTKVYRTDFYIQRGFLVGVSYKDLDLSAYVFNPDATQPTVVVGVSLGF